MSKKINVKMNFDNPELLANLPKKESKPVTTTKTTAVVPKVAPVVEHLSSREFFAGLAMMKFLEDDLRKPPSLQEGATLVAERAWFVANEMEILNKE
jgi:hypothetical protein